MSDRSKWGRIESYQKPPSGVPERLKEELGPPLASLYDEFCDIQHERDRGAITEDEYKKKYRENAAGVMIELAYLLSREPDVAVLGRLKFAITTLFADNPGASSLVGQTIDERIALLHQRK